MATDLKKPVNIKVFIYVFILFIYIIKTTIFLQFYQKLRFKSRSKPKKFPIRTYRKLFVSILPLVYLSFIRHFLSFIYLSQTSTLFVLRDTILVLVD